MIITIDIIYHSITNFEIKINLYFYVVDKSVYDLMCISLSKPLPVLPHRQILNMQLKWLCLNQIELYVCDVAHIEWTDYTNFGVYGMHCLSLLWSCELFVLGV